MPGNADVHDEMLARAAASGDRDAFATLFERHVGPVFAAAWLVLRDRAVAAEIVRDTFLGAWQNAGAVAPAEFAESLVASAEQKAQAWLAENPEALPVSPPGPEEPTGIGPVLRARIVSGLEIQGVPTKVRADASTHQGLDLGPSRPRRARIAPAVAAVTARLKALSTRRTRVGAFGAAAAVLVLGGIVILNGDPGGTSGDDTETAAGDEGRERALAGEVPGESSSDDEDDEETESSSTSSGDPSTTTTTAAGATPGATTNTTAPPRVRNTTTSARPATPPPPPPAPPPPTTPTTRPTTTTPPPPSGPRIVEFTGKVVGSCSGGVNYQMSWKTSGGTWVWIWPSSDPNPWQDVSAPNGSATRCTHYGETWNIATRHDGTHDNDWREVRASRVV